MLRCSSTFPPIGQVRGKIRSLWALTVSNPQPSVPHPPVPSTIPIMPARLWLPRSCLVPYPGCAVRWRGRSPVLGPLAAVARRPKKWCRRGENGKRGDLTHLWASAPPSSTLGAGTHRTTAACPKGDAPLALQSCEISVAFSLRRTSREAIAFRLVSYGHASPSGPLRRDRSCRCRFGSSTRSFAQKSPALRSANQSRRRVTTASAESSRTWETPVLG